MPIAGLTFIEIVTAVNAYYMDYVEYGKYPLDSSKQGYDPVLGNPSGTYGTIFNVLRAIADSNWNTTKCPESAKGFSRERMQESSRSQRAGCHSGHNIGQWFDD